MGDAADEPRPVPKDPAAAFNDYQDNHRSPIDNRPSDNRQQTTGNRQSAITKWAKKGGDRDPTTAVISRLVSRFAATVASLPDGTSDKNKCLDLGSFASLCDMFHCMCHVPFITVTMCH